MGISSSEFANAGLAILKNVALDTNDLRRPPEKGTVSPTEAVLPVSVIRGSRGYLETTTHQINGSYERGWYDACAVMMRKLLETLIIELFERHRIATEIQSASGDFERLEVLIGKAIGNSGWNLSRTTKRALTAVKELGDNSAHGRRFTAHRGDIDNLKVGFRTAVQELVHLARLG